MTLFASLIAQFTSATPKDIPPESPEETVDSDILVLPDLLNDVSEEEWLVSFPCSDEKQAYPSVMEWLNEKADADELATTATTTATTTPRRFSTVNIFKKMLAATSQPACCNCSCHHKPAS